MFERIRGRLKGSKLISDPITSITILMVMASLIVFSIIPLIKIFIQSLTASDGEVSLKAYVSVFNARETFSALINTLWLGTLCGILSTGIGFVFAYSASFVRMRGKKVFNLIALLPIISPPFAVALSIILLFGSRGLITYSLLGIRNANIYGFPGLIFSQTLSYFPIAYLLLTGVLNSIDPSIEEAARNCGASRWHTFKSVTLPLVLPGLANSFLLTFIKSVADFGNPITIGGNYPTLATQIYFQAIGNYNIQSGTAVAILLLLVSMSLYALSKLWVEKKTYVTITGKATRERVLIEEKHIRLPLAGTCLFISYYSKTLTPHLTIDVL